MSVAALPRPAITPVLVAACAELDAASSVALERVTDEDLESAIEVATVAMRRGEALRVALLGEAERRQLAERVGATGTDAWAEALTGDKRAVLAGGLWLARLLGEKYAATRAAFAAGRLSQAQAMVIVRAAEQAPAEATPAQVAAAEQWLVDRATGDATRHGRPLSPGRLRQTARRMFSAVDPLLAARHEAAMLGRSERAAEAECWLTLGDNGNGTWTGRFTIPELHGHLLSSVLDTLVAPRRAAGVQPDPSAPPQSSSEARGAAFCEVLEHLPTTGWATQTTTAVTVTVGLDRLRDGLGAARLETGTAITASEARRLACTAGITPAVLGGESRVLDLGRSRRLHTPAQRTALSITYDSCGIETCERPFAWTEVHHPHWWSRGGPTDLANAVPLCGHHHRRAHDDRFDLRRQPGGGWRLHPRR